VTQTIRRRAGEWQTQVEGVVVKHESRRTGSWYAHAYKGRLWLNRLTLRKDDGELVRLTLDESTKVTLCQPAASSGPGGVATAG
jgi:hypothetical protein